MRWEESGDGVPVVLLHGIPTSPALWRRAVPLLQGVRSLAWEMVGYGDSLEEGLGRDISVGRQADYLLSWMEAIGLDRAVLVGHDLGGGVAQIAAVRQPRACAGLVLTNSIAYDSWPIPSVKALRVMGGMLEHLTAGVLKPIFGMMLARGHDQRRVARESLRIHLKPYLARGGAAPFVRQIRSLRTEDTLSVADALPKLEVPTRLVWGAADRFQKLRYGRRLAADLRASHLDAIEGGKHFTPEDHPHRIARAVHEVAEEAGARA